MKIKLLFTATILLFCIGISHATVSDCTVVNDEIQYCLTLEKDVYVQGETVQMVFSITNLRADTLGFPYSCSQARAQFFARNTTGTDVWDAPFCFPMGWGELLLAGQTVADTVEWDMTDTEGQPVDPGDYTVKGRALTWLHPAPFVNIPIEITDTTGIPELTEPATWSTVKSLFR